MDVAKLKQFMRERDIHRRLLAGYAGGYSLGIGGAADSAVLVLQVEPQAPTGRFPTDITLDGQIVSVQVKPTFVRPKALARSNP